MLCWRRAAGLTVNYTFLRGLSKKHIQYVSCQHVSTRINGIGGYSLKSLKEIEPKGWLLLLIPCAAFGLGTWQVKRRKWKLDLIADLQRRTHSQPRNLPDTLAELQDIEYCPVHVKGTFDHSKELYLGPRSFIQNGDASSEGSLMSSSAGVGYCVVTPFHLSDEDLTILVNRGWVSKKYKNPASRKAGQIEGEVELVGLVRLNEKRGPFMPENKGETWLYRDLTRMAQKTNTAPIFLDAVEESSIPGGPVGGQTRVSLRNEHLSYILTWFGLSAATGFLWIRTFLLR